MKNKPKTNEERRRELYFSKWGLNEKNSTGDLRSDMRVWVEEANKEKADQEKKNKSVKAIPIDIDGITRSRLEYENLHNVKDEYLKEYDLSPDQSLGELLSKMYKDKKVSNDGGKDD